MQGNAQTPVSSNCTTTPRTLTRTSISLNLAFRLFDLFDKIESCSDEVSVWSEAS